MRNFLKLLLSIFITSLVFFIGWGVNYLVEHNINFSNYICYGVLFVLITLVVYLFLSDRNLED